MNLRGNQRLFVWCGPAGVVVWMIGFMFCAHFVPPPAPIHDAGEVAALYQANRTGIRIGLLLSTFGAALFMPYFTVVSVQLRRIEGRYSPVAWTQLGLAAATVVAFALPTMILQAAAYRADRPATEVQLLNDLGWLIFIGLISIGVLQWAVIGFGILRDHREVPVLPRWSGYLSIWSSLLFAPGAACVFFYSGPLAWDGIFTWWIPASVFSIWICAMTPVLLRAVNAQASEGAMDDQEPDLTVVLAETMSLRAEVEALRERVGTA